MAVKQILRDFSGWTSAHGIPHVGSAQNWWLRGFWTFTVVVCCGMFTWQIFGIFVKYFTYGVNVAIELKFEERYFPAVTICNLNPYKSPVIDDATDPASPYHDMHRLMHDYSRAIGGVVLSPDDFMFNGLGTSIAIQTRAKEEMAFLAAQLRQADPVAFQDLLYTRDDVVKNCAYNTQPCNANSSISEDFEEVIDPVYGQCFTFNPKSPEPDHKSTRAGPLYGLRAVIMTNQTEYLPITNSAGVRVTIHNQGEDPFPDAFGFNAATGFVTAFGVKYVNSSRKEEPYGNCTTDKGVSAFYYDSYSLEGCFRSCFQENIVKECECADPRFERPDEATPYCTRDFRPNITDCLAKFLSNDAETGFDAIANCECVPPCESGEFGVTPSTALWPSDVFVPQDCRTYPSPHPAQWTDQPGCVQWYRENTLLIEAYFERINYQLLSESEAYAVVNVVSDMGSQLGLWMGISVITVTELFSLGVLLCLYACSRNKGQIASDADSDDEEAHKA